MSTLIFRGTRRRADTLDGLGELNAFQLSSIIVASAIVVVVGLSTIRRAPVETAINEASPTVVADRWPDVALTSLPLVTAPLQQRSAPASQAAIDRTKDHARLEEDSASLPDAARQRLLVKLSYIPYYPYAEIPLAEKPADLVLAWLKDVPVGTSVEEIKRAAAVFGMNFSFMKAVAKIESDFDPKQRTGSYIGLFQLSRYEFDKYGSGDILDPRDNAVAAAYKFLTEADLFEWDTRKKPTFSDLYLIHQQGWQGAAEHVAHPERIAWKSMCATDEGREKGEKWCKRAVWGNTLPNIKQAWKSVERMTSAAFVAMWQQRVNLFYSRYSAAEAVEQKPEPEPISGQ